MVPDPARPSASLPSLALLVLLVHLGLLAGIGASHRAPARPLLLRVLHPAEGPLAADAAADAQRPAAPRSTGDRPPQPPESVEKRHPPAPHPPATEPASAGHPFLGDAAGPAAPAHLPSIADAAVAATGGDAPAAATAPTADIRDTTESAGAMLALPSAFVLRYGPRPDPGTAAADDGTVAGAAAPDVAELGFDTDGRHYRAWLRLTPPGESPRVLVSEGDLGPQGLRPLRFLERRRAAMAAHFHWTEGRIRFSGQHPDAPLSAGTQDGVSVLIQLSARLAGPGPVPAPGTGWSVWTATARDAGMQVWQVLSGDETTVRLQRLPRHPFEPLLETWHAPARQGLPVRLRLTGADGRSLDLYRLDGPHHR